MKGIEINFMNRPNSDGTITKSIVIADCLIAQSGSPTIRKPQVTVHLPKASQERVDGAWFSYDGNMYHVIGTTAKSMDDNTPTRWNRYAIAERVY